jgi:TonB family protein
MKLLLFGALLLISFAASADDVLSQLPPLDSYERPEFPESLRVNAVTDGTATVGMTIATDGQVETVSVIAASDPELGTAVARAVQSWKLAISKNTGASRQEVIQFVFRDSTLVSAKRERTGAPQRTAKNTG